MEYPGLEVNQTIGSPEAVSLLKQTPSKWAKGKNILFALCALLTSFFSNLVLVRAIEAKGHIQFVLQDCRMLPIGTPLSRFPCMTFDEILVRYALFAFIVLAVTVLLYFFFKKLVQLVKV